ncbi:peroxide stress protein YaaA [Phenylobacterium aquaticum]|uniref:peroxide stress protein YaaA n=1 Tax=Phenylobacterium aquaticum TaxID=1763816 RepID=UPI001F5D5926|nr:peroxide stress protein YaaA [Phenylobacterium aquaticum]MCI3134697.1 peroxide stress protein YaaA [Phenylobacterium aquaticum]
MLIVLSPAKAMNFTPPAQAVAATTPEMAADIAELDKTTRKLTTAQLKRLMDLSDNLAQLNRERFQAFDPAMEDGLQAAFAFNGDVYAGLKARELDKKGLAYAQEHVRILSGLYGLLRPLDAIQPYRLEMGTRLKTQRGPSLYAFWGDRIATALDQALVGHKDRMLVNCASGEYFGAVDLKALKAPVINVRFLEEKDGSAKIISFFAKKARGLMARYAIDHRLEKAVDLKAFDAEGYRFQPSASTDAEWVFSRPQPPPPSAAKKG